MLSWRATFYAEHAGMQAFFFSFGRPAGKLIRVQFVRIIGLSSLSMDIADYLARIRFGGPIEPTKEVLFALHRAHLARIAYENLDIHLGTALTVQLDDIYEKIVRRGRGGWCFEMNGLFAWALREIGFEVTMYAANVRRETPYECVGDHLVLKVELEEPYLADVGFGTGFYDPLPLAVGSYRQDFLDVRLELHDDCWQFIDVSQQGRGYDFTAIPRTLESFAKTCDWLQTSPESGFVQTTVCQRVQPGRLDVLRGAVRTFVEASGTSTQIVSGADEFEQLVRDDFGLPLRNVEELWSKVWDKHQEWLRNDPNALS